MSRYIYKAYNKRYPFVRSLKRGEHLDWQGRAMLIFLALQMKKRGTTRSTIAARFNLSYCTSHRITDEAMQMLNEDIRASLGLPPWSLRPVDIRLLRRLAASDDRPRSFPAVGSEGTLSSQGVRPPGSRRPGKGPRRGIRRPG